MDTIVLRGAKRKSFEIDDIEDFEIVEAPALQEAPAAMELQGKIECAISAGTHLFAGKRSVSGECAADFERGLGACVIDPRGRESLITAWPCVPSRWDMPDPRVKCRCGT